MLSIPWRCPVGEGEAPVIKGVYVSQPASYKVDSRELKLGPGDGIEIKYHMQKGSAMVYSWKAGAVVSYELHGEPDVKPAGAGSDYYESYDNSMRKGKDQSYGAFTFAEHWDSGMVLGECRRRTGDYKADDRGLLRLHPAEQRRQEDQAAALRSEITQQHIYKN